MTSTFEQIHHNMCRRFSNGFMCWNVFPRPSRPGGCGGGCNQCGNCKSTSLDDGGMKGLHTCNCDSTFSSKKWEQRHILSLKISAGVNLQYGGVE